MLFGQISALLFSIPVLYCNFINTLYKLWRNISNNLTLQFDPTPDEFANENTQHMPLILDFDVDHILTANRIDDEHSDDEHWFSDESGARSGGILLFSYLYGFINFC